MTRPKRYSLAIEMTGYCNQKCSYCYNDWRDDGGTSVGALSGEALCELVDRALTDVEFDHVTLTGGEPFSRPEVFDVLAVVKKHGLRAQIISNGGMITDAIAQKLKPFKPYYVQVTLNGHTEELHEEHVGLGHNHYQRTLRGLEALRAAKIPISGCVVVTHKNADVVEQIFERFASFGVKSIAFSRFSPAGYASNFAAELLPTRSDMLRALAVAEKWSAAGKMSVQVTMPVPACVVDHAEFPNVRFGGCPIGTEAQEFALGPDGQVRNCTLHHDRVGDTRTQSFAEIVTAPEVAAYRDVTPEFCAPCPYRASCQGGCGAAAVSIEGRRGLDPFVAQHVDEDVRAAFKAARSGQTSFVSAARLRRKASAQAALSAAAKQ